MVPPDLASSDELCLPELRRLVAALRAELAELKAETILLRRENQALKDEVARLKGLPPRPPVRPKPSGMETATQREAAGALKRNKAARRRGSTRDKLTISQQIVLRAKAAPGSRFKGYEDILVQDLELAARTICYRRERWLTPSGASVVAALPCGILGGYGPQLRRFVLCAHIQGQVTTERLTALLNGIGIAISKRQVVRLLSADLDDLVAEDQEVLRTGLKTARWISVDDTPACHANTDGYTTQIGDQRFTAFRTGPGKSREAFLAVLRAGHPEYILNAAALAYMRSRALAGAVIARLAAHPTKSFADEAAWRAHLAVLGLDTLAVEPNPVKIATEGALWGTIRQHGLLEGTVIVSDDAGQFRVGEHALCWVHAERLVHKLVPVAQAHRRAIDIARQLIWWFYRDLKAYQRDPCRRRASALRARFERIFQRRTGYILLDRLLARLHRRKAELLRVLERPEIPLHTNGSENDIRAFVTKRKVSGGTVSEAGRTARDVLLGLLKTCQKLGVSFFHYLGDRLAVPDTPKIAPLPDLVRQAAQA
jgi:hypothetical protein